MILEKSLYHLSLRYVSFKMCYIINLPECFYCIGFALKYEHATWKFSNAYNLFDCSDNTLNCKLNFWNLISIEWCTDHSWLGISQSRFNSKSRENNYLNQGQTRRPHFTSKHPRVLIIAPKLEPQDTKDSSGKHWLNGLVVTLNRLNVPLSNTQT
jgi:hypothetical protein